MCLQAREHQGRHTLWAEERSESRDWKFSSSSRLDWRERHPSDISWHHFPTPRIQRISYKVLGWKIKFSMKEKNSAWCQTSRCHVDDRGWETSRCRFGFWEERRAIDTLWVELSIPARVTTTLPPEKDQTENNPIEKCEEERKPELYKYVTLYYLLYMYK